MPRFVLFLEETPGDFANVSPEEMQQIIERYVAWRKGIEASGRHIQGIKLKDEGGRRVTRAGGKVQVMDGPYAEAKEVLGGVFVIDAADYDDAGRLASECPHIDFGRILIREVDVV